MTCHSILVHCARLRYLGSDLPSPGNIATTVSIAVKHLPQAQINLFVNSDSNLQLSMTQAGGQGYDIKQASRQMLEEDLQIVREQLVPRLEQLQQQNEALKQGGQPTAGPDAPRKGTATRSGIGYDIKSAPRDLLEEDLLIVRTHLLPRMGQLQAENEALTAALKAQQGQQESQQ